MLSLFVDFNNCEDSDYVVVMVDSRFNPKVLVSELTQGLRVLLHDNESLQFEGILEHGATSAWVAKLLRETRLDVPPEQWDWAAATSQKF